MSGILLADLMAGVKELRERDVYNSLHQFTEGAEYRGVRSDGSHFRWVGLAGERVLYDHASAESARFFDQIVDTLCWLKPNESRSRAR